MVLCFQITAVLEKYPVWKEYKDQKHDLFLSDKPVAGYLTGIVDIPLAKSFQFCAWAMVFVLHLLRLFYVVGSFLQITKSCSKYIFFLC